MGGGWTDDSVHATEAISCSGMIHYRFILDDEFCIYLFWCSETIEVCLVFSLLLQEFLKRWVLNLGRKLVTQFGLKMLQML